VRRSHGRKGESEKTREGSRVFREKEGKISGYRVQFPAGGENIEVRRVEKLGFEEKKLSHVHTRKGEKGGRQVGLFRMWWEKKSGHNRQTS